MASTMDPTESVALSDVDAQMCENLEAVPPKKPKKKRGSKKKSKKKNHEESSDAGGDDELFHVISNPQKMLPKPRKSSHNSGKKKKRKNASSVRSMSSLSDSSDDNNMMSSIGPNSFRSQESFGGSIPYADDASAGDADDSQGFGRRRRSEEVMQEKVEMLTRISKMSKQGFAVTKRWSVRDDIDEIRFECYRMTRESNSKKAVKSMQHGLITLATILEFANSVLNPFNLKLQGFSRNMMLTVSDYDDSLEAIHHKWSGKTAIGPELTVLFTFATSAVFHHAGNVSSSSSPPTSRQQGTNKTGGGMGLGDMSSMLALFSNIVPKGAAEKTAAKPVAPPDQKQKQRRPMKGPTAVMPSASMSLP